MLRDRLWARTEGGWLLELSLADASVLRHQRLVAGDACCSEGHRTIDGRYLWIEGDLGRGWGGHTAINDLRHPDRAWEVREVTSVGLIAGHREHLVHASADEPGQPWRTLRGGAR